jgi:hypothetical protein
MMNSKIHELKLMAGLLLNEPYFSLNSEPLPVITNPCLIFVKYFADEFQ